MKILRYRIFVKGRVQGVGFRPTIYKYAKNLNINGFVCNTGKGVLIDVEGKIENIEKFIEKLKNSPPPRAEIKEIKIEKLDHIKGYKNFEIIKSIPDREIEVEISPDIATCKDCIKELFNKKDRRYFFPFINCTNCGPRFTIIKNIPYDRENTTMNEFKMCEECKKEYEDPFSRRFHAQPNCCFICGPVLKLFDNKGKYICEGKDAIKEASELLKEGKIIGIKGIGGYHLACDAENEKTIKILRERKKRYEKPFALMARNVETIKKYCYISEIEEKILKSWQAPILLLRKKGNFLPEEIAPNNKYLGFFLPYTPIHHLIFKCNKNINILIMTSGNLTEEPIIYEDEVAFKMLKNICDFFLTHNRKIYVNCDDSVVRVFNKEIYFIRRSRGFVPSPVLIPYYFKKNIFSAGSDLKNTFAFAKENKVFLSQHIGDLENYLSIESYKKSIELFKRILKFEPEIIVCDMHPNYFSSKIAKEIFSNIKNISVQHHHSHIASCMADNFCKNEKVIGIAFDGTGYGVDGNIWGGEILICDYKNFERVGHLRYFPLAGGEVSIKEIWRIGAVYLYVIFGDEFLNLDIDFVKKIDKDKWKIIKKMVDKNINCLLNSSMGRLFDAVSSILCLKDKISYEGQGGIELEMRIENCERIPYDYEIKKENSVYIIDPEKTIKEIVSDIERKTEVGKISYRFHITIVDMVKNICKILRKEREINKVVLSGGVFQNTFLLSKLTNILEKEKFEVLIHRKVPANDGGISLGQAILGLFKTENI
ncbi:MAG: carbamoyltransferase HypF [Candidatus Omnitrophica bacterium]|nr:carbamoyltransferase HypF [Candidatus Omnitrophota bacterium]